MQCNYCMKDKTKYFKSIEKGDILCFECQAKVKNLLYFAPSNLYYCSVDILPAPKNLLLDIWSYWELSFYEKCEERI